MLYALVIWLSVSLSLVFLECIVYALLATRSLAASDLLLTPPLQLQEIIQHARLGSWGLTLIAAGSALFILGYLLEAHTRPIERIYRHLQAIYPAFYTRIPPDLRELFIGGALLVLTELLALGTILAGFLPGRLTWLALTLPVFFNLGMLLPPLLRYRTTQLLDRPEKPLQAAIHKVIPRFPLSLSLVLGQLYLKYLLPLFSLCLILLIPLYLSILNINDGQYLILLGGLMAGLGLGWVGCRSSALSLEAFKANLLNLGLLAGTATALLVFGIASESTGVLVLSSLFSGFLVGNY